MVIFAFLAILTCLSGFGNSETVLLSTYATATNDKKAPISLLPSQDDASTLQLATEPPNQGRPLRHYRIPNGTPAGVYFRISQKGINYITSLAEEALPQLFENSLLPDVDHPQIKLTHIMIENFGDPKLAAKFIDQKGVGVQVHLPQVTLSAVYDASTFFKVYKGKFKADIQNLSLIMEVHISRNETEKINIIETPVCNVTSSRVRIVFAGDMSTYLNLVRTVVEEMIVDILGTELCKMGQTVTEFFEQQKRQILMTTPAPPPTSSPAPSPTYLLQFGVPFEVSRTTTPIPEGNDFYDSSEDVEEEEAPNFMADFCSEDRLDLPTRDEETIQLRREKRQLFTTLSPSTVFNPLLIEGLWAPDLTLMYAPQFSNQDVVFGLDGGIIFYGRRAKNVERPSFLNISALGEQMFGLIVSEYVPNTFFAHVYDEGLGTIQEVFRTHNLPKFIKPIAKLFCSRCELLLTANLTGRPHISINNNGVKLSIDGDVSIVFSSKTRKRNIISANTVLEATVRPYLRHSRIYGDVALTSVDIKVKGLGVGGMFANSVKKALNAVVPKKLWPKIKKRLRFALNQRGIKLPVMCGLELERPSLSYIDHAVVIDTDFSYDLPRFIRKFKAYLAAEVARAKNKQQEENSEEDY